MNDVRILPPLVAVLIIGSLLFSAFVAVAQRTDSGTIESPREFLSTSGATPLSSSSERFVYQSWSGNMALGIATADVNGQNIVQVTTVSSDENPAMTADGRTIVFNRNDPSGDGTRDLYLVDGDGQNPRLLYNETEFLGWSSHPAFSPDRNEVVFERRPRPGFGFSDLYRIDTDGQNLIRLTSNPGWKSEPAFSPDGNLIAFSAVDETYLDNFQIITISRDGTGWTNLTPDDSCYNDFAPAFSPDGSQIVFSRRHCISAIDEIWKINADGSGLTELTITTGGFSRYPTWSNDGKTIVFARYGQNYSWWGEIWKMDADGSNLEEINLSGASPAFGQGNGLTAGGELFENLDVVFALDPGGDYQATISASDSIYGIARYELAVDSHDDQDYIVKDSFDVDCSAGCPAVGPTVNLTLSSSEVQNGESDLRASAIDGAGNPVFQSRPVNKGFFVGITEPRIGRPLRGTDPEDPNPFPIYDPIVFAPDLADPRFAGLKVKYFRLFVPWERLEPTNDVYQWDADVGGGYAPGDPLRPLYKSTIDDQINRIREIDPGVQIVAVFYQTPCWAIIPQARIWDNATQQYKDPCSISYGRFPDNNRASWPDPYRGMVAEYKEFVAEFIKRYSGPQVPAQDRITFYAAWNEPNYFDQAQPQKCGQPHKNQAEHPEFASIRCPYGNPPGAVTADDYYYLLYSALYDTIGGEVPGMPGERFDPSIKVLGGETAGVGRRSPQAFDSDEAAFAKSVIKRMKRDSRCGADADGIKTLGAWSKHAYSDLEESSYTTVQRLRRTLDGLNPDTGETDPTVDTTGCTKNKQMWISEVSAIYRNNPTRDAPAACKLHDFLEGVNTAPEDPPGSGRHPDLRRTDVYMQYLYQADGSYGLLNTTDQNPQDGLLDPRNSFYVFNDWAQYAQGLRSKPTRSDYEGAPFNCQNFWGP